MMADFENHQKHGAKHTLSPLVWGSLIVELRAKDWISLKIPVNQRENIHSLSMPSREITHHPEPLSEKSTLLN